MVNQQHSWLWLCCRETSLAECLNAVDRAFLLFRLYQVLRVAQICLINLILAVSKWPVPLFCLGPPLFPHIVECSIIMSMLGPMLIRCPCGWAVKADMVRCLELAATAFYAWNSAVRIDFADAEIYQHVCIIGPLRTRAIDPICILF